jgi:hypothetical protein
MQLIPTLPPGRSNRKARAFLAEIARLAVGGYGCRAIHGALANAGLQVSPSTVKRELARVPKPRPAIAREVALPLPSRPPIESREAPVPDQRWPAEAQPSGRDIAEAFVKGRITNPLLRPRS